MSDKIDLRAIEGHRGKLEFQISYALFTIFDQKKLDKKLDEIHSKLVPKGKLTLVPGNSKKMLSIHFCQAAQKNCLNLRWKLNG